MADDEVVLKKRSITSEGLSKGAIRACWTVAVILMTSGISATFIAGTGAAPASMILFGSLFLILALMRRVPLSLEVGGAKFDASYERDEAYDAGREAGRQQGVEVALRDVEDAEKSGESPHVALERRLDTWEQWREASRIAHRNRSALRSGDQHGYPASVVMEVAGVTWKQLDYWDRSGLVSPVGVDATGSGLYLEDDIVILKAAKRLLDTGVSMQLVRVALDHLRDRTPSALDMITLMSDGHSVYEATSADEVIDLVQSGQGVFGIAVGRVRREVTDALRRWEGPDDDPSGQASRVA